MQMQPPKDTDTNSLVLVPEADLEVVGRGQELHPPTSSPLETATVHSTELIVQKLLAQGLSRDEIVMPGGAKGHVLYIASDFDAPLEDFADYK